MKCTKCGKDITVLGTPVVVVYKGKYAPESMLIRLEPTKPEELYHEECWNRLQNVAEEVEGRVQPTEDPLLKLVVDAKALRRKTYDPVEKARLERADLESRTIRMGKEEGKVQ